MYLSSTQLDFPHNMRNCSLALCSVSNSVHSLFSNSIHPSLKSDKRSLSQVLLIYNCYQSWYLQRQTISCGRYACKTSWPSRQGTHHHRNIYIYIYIYLYTRQACCNFMFLSKPKYIALQNITRTICGMRSWLNHWGWVTFVYTSGKQYYHLVPDVWCQSIYLHQCCFIL